MYKFLGLIFNFELYLKIKFASDVKIVISGYMLKYLIILNYLIWKFTLINL